jgi:hypothetical protein
MRRLFDCRRTFLPFFALLLLNACGGGGGGGSSGVTGGPSSSSISSVNSSSSSVSSASSSTPSGLVAKPRYLVAAVTPDLYIFPSTTLSAPALTKVATSALGYIQMNGVLYYFAADGSNAVHLYGVKLDDVSVVPSPYQVGALVLSSTSEVCYFQGYWDNQSDPATGKILIRVAGTNHICGDVDDLNETIKVSDTPSDQPQLSAFQQPFRSIWMLYSKSGVNLGAMYIEPTSGDLKFANAADFSQAVTLAPIGGNPNYSIWYANWDYAPIYYVPFPGSAGQTVLFRTSLNGGYTPIYTSKGYAPVCCTDSNNIYFSDDYGYPRKYDIYKLASIMTAQPQLIYSESFTDSAVGDVRGIVGSVVSSLVLYKYNKTPNQSYIQTISTNTFSTSGTTLRTFDGALLDRFLYTEAGKDQSTSVIVAVRWNNALSVPGYVSEVFKSDGTQLIAPTNNMAIKRLDSYSNQVLAYKDITDMDGNLGGASVNDINLTTGTIIPYTSADGSIFRIGKGQTVYFDGGSTEYGFVKVGYPSTYSIYQLDTTRPYMQLLVDFVSRKIYVLPLTIDGTAVRYM